MLRLFACSSFGCCLRRCGPAWLSHFAAGRAVAVRLDPRGQRRNAAAPQCAQLLRPGSARSPSPPCLGCAEGFAPPTPPARGLVSCSCPCRGSLCFGASNLVSGRCSSQRSRATLARRGRPGFARASPAARASPLWRSRGATCSRFPLFRAFVRPWRPLVCAGAFFSSRSLFCSVFRFAASLFSSLFWTTFTPDEKGLRPFADRHFRDAQRRERFFRVSQWRPCGHVVPSRCTTGLFAPGSLGALLTAVGSILHEIGSRTDAWRCTPLGLRSLLRKRRALAFRARVLLSASGVSGCVARGFALAGFSAARCLPSCRFASALAESARPGRAALLAALVRRSSACHMTYRLV